MIKCCYSGCKNPADYLVHSRLKYSKDYCICSKHANESIKQSAIDGKPFGYNNMPIFTATKIN